MKSATSMFPLALLALCSCNREPGQPAVNDFAAPMNATVPPEPAKNVTHTPAMNDAAPLAEPAGPIDPKSAEAAGQVVQHYGALIEQKRFLEARALWGDPTGAEQFESRLKGYANVHLEIGNPGDMEGAAGSIYVTIPVILYGESQSNQPFRCSGDVTLRRVNDVPGSTEAQRRWHISAIQC